MSETPTTDHDRSAAGRLSRDPISRRRFMVASAGTGAAAAFLAACGGDDDQAATDDAMRTDTADGGADPLAQFGEGDVGIVNYALTLEYLEAAFYAQVAKSGLFKGDDLALIRTFGRHEQDHVDALRSTVRDLGAMPAAKPKTDFPLDSAEAVLDLAATVENLGAAAYLGQAANIQSEDILAAALSIHSVEARHAAALNTLIGKSFVPDGPFAEPADAQTVLDQVQPFIVS